ncbi:sensor histidine kinase [Deinococcus arcticus]|uniref:histidine kinase n=1 Tax=Deinococcus arcticus TaxID=2136176 RepID=A0A2T3W624_9DEIO|nr:ATP-binding protein [Deinococcus arcticus]PTA67213.1 hypothetical protein C8263_14050 [Deinococcus arcticus]
MGLILGYGLPEPLPPGVSGVPSADELLARVQGGGEPVDAVLLGTGTPQALRVIQRLHAADRLLAVRLLGPPAPAQALLQAARFTPQIGPHLAWVNEPPEELGPALQAAAAQTRTRREHARQVARTNAQLSPAAVPAPAPFLEHLLDQAPLGVVTLNLQGQAVDWNPAAARLLPELRAGLNLRAALPAFPPGPVPGAVRLERPLGGERQVLRVHLSAMQRPAHGPGLLALLEDITAFVRAEEERDRAGAELRALNQTLEARVAERTQALEAQTQALEAQTRALEAQTLALQRSNSELERFAYVTSHDLQEPLRTITSFTALLVSRAGPGLDPRTAQYLRFIQEGSARMKAQIDDLLHYARLNAGPRPLRPVPLAEPLQEALDRLQALAEEAQAQFEVEPLPTVLGDAPQLAQLLQNLVGNALKFRREGAAARVQVWAQPGPAPGLWRIQVRDNGIGIEPQYFGRIFEMFQRLHRRESYSGTGLGLAICRKIVQAHGGEIGVESEPGGGSTFWFTLPAA